MLGCCASLKCGEEKRILKRLFKVARAKLQTPKGSNHHFKQYFSHIWTYSAKMLVKRNLYKGCRPGQDWVFPVSLFVRVAAQVLGLQKWQKFWNNQALIVLLFKTKRADWLCPAQIYKMTSILNPSMTSEVNKKSVLLRLGQYQHHTKFQLNPFSGFWVLSEQTLVAEA